MPPLWYHDRIAARAVPILLALLGGLIVLEAPASAAAGVPCPRGEGLRCLSVTVPLDRSGTVPGTIRLRAARVRSRRPSRAPLVALSGGPGQAGVAFGSTFATTVRTPGRDLVVLDQRGTGASGLLRCRTFERRLAVSFATPAGSCGRALGARRSFYTSADSAEDLEALRIRLGAPALALYGVSYGTRVALEYAGRYPRRVERLLLDSPVPLGGADVFARETFAAIPRVIRAACGYGCGGADRRPVSDLRRLAQRLRRSPVRRRVSRRGRRVPVRVDADDLLGLLVTGDLLPPFLQDIPRAVRDALAGRTGRLARLKLEARRIDEVGPVREFAPAVFAATLCEESPVAWDRAADPATRRRQAAAALAAVPAGAFAPFDRAAARDAGLMSLCLDWPAPRRTPPPDAPLPTGIPTLVLSGELDLRTPLESARRLAAALPGSQLLMERGVGHSVLGADLEGCASPAARAFLLGRALPRCARR